MVFWLSGCGCCVMFYYSVRSCVQFPLVYFFPSPNNYVIQKYTLSPEGMFANTRFSWEQCWQTLLFVLRENVCKYLTQIVFESPVHRTEKKPQTGPDCNWFEPDHRLQLQQLSYQSSFSFSVFEILQNRRKTGLNRLQPVFLLFCTSHQLPLYIGSTATKKSPKSVKIWLSYNQNNFHQYWQPNPVQDFIVSQSFLIRFT